MFLLRANFSVFRRQGAPLLTVEIWVVFAQEPPLPPSRGQAQLNHQRQVSSKTFEQVRQDSKDEWNAVMRRADVVDMGDGYTEQEKEDFLTTFYRCVVCLLAVKFQSYSNRKFSLFAVFRSLGVFVVFLLKKTRHLPA